MPTKSLLSHLFLASTLASLAACGGGHRVADITPAHTAVLTGHWVFDDVDSDDIAAILEEMGRARQPAGGASPADGAGRGGGRTGGGMTGGGMTGGRGGGSGGMSGRSPMSGGAMDPEAMAVTQRLIRQRVPSMELVLTDSMVTVTYPREEPYVLLFGEKVERELRGGLTLQAKADWHNGRLRIRRSIDGGGSITELFMPAVDGTLLTVAVEAEMGRGRSFEFRRVFTPRSSGDER